MRKQFLFAACTLFAASALVMTSCQQTEEPIANDPTDQAGPMTRAATLGNFYRVVYVEVNDVNPLNAGEYLLSDGTPFFTHVILFASNIRGTPAFQPLLQYVLLPVHGRRKGQQQGKQCYLSHRAIIRSITTGLNSPEGCNCESGRHGLFSVHVPR